MIGDVAYPGATLTAEGVSFLCWAPKAQTVEVALASPTGGPARLGMDPTGNGYFRVVTDRAGAGTRYTYRIDGQRVFPDPASASQPDGVHDASEVVDHRRFEWTDGDFSAPDLADLVLYELHVGTFTAEGTFDAAVPRLSALSELGVTAVEIMPVAQFPGARNWGYDGVYPFAVQTSYGGPEGLRRFVDAAHGAGIAVVLDVVYNHFGPEGNYSGQFGDYFTDRYRTPWGDAVNVDGAGSDAVRWFFLSNLRHWMERYHIDGFRLDAVHEIHDESAIPFLAEVGEAVHEFGLRSGRPRFVIAESDLNDRRIVEPIERHGMGLDAAWADDFHHAVHAALTGERRGYFADFGALEHIARSVAGGWSYRGEYSTHRERRHGNSPAGVPPARLVFCTQNHDQVGNRMMGDRLVSLVGRHADRLSRSLLLLSPAVPLLFMGQEYGEERPFLYFVDHGDPELLAATREGRAREFSAFQDEGAPPDPGDSTTMAASVLRWNSRLEGEHAVDLELTTRLLALRRRYDCFRPGPLGAAAASIGVSGATLPERRAVVLGSCVVLFSAGQRDSGIVVANFLDRSATVAAEGIASALGIGFPLDELDWVFHLRRADSPIRSGGIELEAFDLAAAVDPRSSAERRLQFAH